MNNHGVTLIELLASVSLVVVVVSMTALFFSKASKASVSGRYVMTAKNLALGKIQELKEQPYALIPITPAGSFPAGQAATCDCGAVPVIAFDTTFGFLDFTLSPPGTYIEKGITYTRRVCINLVDHAGGTWSSNCPDVPLTDARDHGLKNIRVRVTWSMGTGSAPQSVDMESMVHQ